MKTLYSGEALTADDMYERQEEEDKHKLEKEQQKAARAKARLGGVFYSTQNTYTFTIQIQVKQSPGTPAGKKRKLMHPTTHTWSSQTATVHLRCD